MLKNITKRTFRLLYLKAVLCRPKIFFKKFRFVLAILKAEIRKAEHVRSSSGHRF